MLNYTQCAEPLVPICVRGLNVDSPLHNQVRTEVTAVESAKRKPSKQSSKDHFGNWDGGGHCFLVQPRDTLYRLLTEWKNNGTQVLRNVFGPFQGAHKINILFFLSVFPYTCPAPLQ